MNTSQCLHFSQSMVNLKQLQVIKKTKSDSELCCVFCPVRRTYKYSNLNINYDSSNNILNGIFT